MLSFARATKNVKTHSPSDFTDEARLILLLCRGAISLREWDQVRDLLSMRLGWDWILDQVILEEIYPLFYKNLEKLGFPEVPEHVRVRLHDIWKINGLRNTLLKEELVRVLGRLDEAGIAAIALKGVALSQLLYGDPTLRVCSDIDILVPWEKGFRAFEALQSVGYTCALTSSFFWRLLLRHDIEYPLLREQEGFQYLVEIHWGVLWGGRSETKVMREIWREARPARVLGISAYDLSPEWQLLVLAAHAARHQWQGLKWLVDLHDHCSSTKIDWQKANDIATRLGWQRILDVSFRICHVFFATSRPPNLSRDTLPTWLKLFPDTDPLSRRNAFFPTRLMLRPSEKLRYLVRVFFVPTLAEHELIRLPQRLSFLYYCVRSVRLVCKWTCVFLNRYLSKLNLIGRFGSRIQNSPPRTELQLNFDDEHRTKLRST